MDLRVEGTAESAAYLAADLVEKVIRSDPRSAILPATGNTPISTYGHLAERALPTSRLRVFQLDEYVGVSAGDPRSLYGWTKRAFLDPLHIDPAQVTRLRGDSRDLPQACADYEAAVASAGGIDLAILGLGLDGHLGYNEPPSPADAPTRAVTLRPESKASAAAYFPPGTAVPDRGITAGMTIILAARSILLLVTGESKRGILRAVLDGPIGPEVPASYLRTVPGVTVVVDRDALGDVA
jgi:glucosamine-6-phosphate deaminase